MNIVYCDDDQEDSEFFKKAINKINPKINCTTSLDAEEALNILASEEKKTDAIFIDLHMPKLGGLECVIAIKRNKSLKRIAVIILSKGWVNFKLNNSTSLVFLGLFLKQHLKI